MFDIYGGHLRPGHCEVHPHVHESYPCSLCIAEAAQREQERQACNDHMAAEYEAWIEAQLQERIEELIGVDGDGI